MIIIHLSYTKVKYYQNILNVMLRNNLNIYSMLIIIETKLVIVTVNK